MNVIIEEPRNPENKIINAKDYGMDPKNIDNYAELFAALTACRAAAPATLIIPKGVYKFNTGMYIQIMYLYDVLIDGQGSEFVFSGTGYFQIIGCQRVEIRNLYVDWDWEKKRIGDLFRVSKAGPNGLYFDCTFFEIENADPSMIWETVNQFDPETLTPGVENGKEYWKGSLGFNKVEKIGPNVLRIYPLSSLDFNVNDVYMVRHIKCLAHAFEVQTASSNITFREVVIYSAPGMGFGVYGDANHIQLLGCKIMLKPNTNRHLSTYADGFHVASSQGYIRLENCDFSYMGDDAVNLHDNVGIVIGKDNDVLSVRTAQTFKKGDSIEVRSSDLSTVQYTSVIISTEPGDLSGVINFTMKDAIPEIIAKNCVVINKRYTTGNYIIKNNYFHENRARGMLIQAPNGLIEGNKFYKNQGPAILITTDINYDHWQEGAGADNVVCRNNTIQNCDICNWGSAIQMIAHLPDGKGNCSLFTNIVFDHNTLIDTTSESFYLQYGSNITVKNNIIKNPASKNKNLEDSGTITVDNSMNVLIANNHWQHLLI